MPEETTQPTTETTEQEAVGGEQSPPWGSDEEFDPERAWKLIQNLRSESADAKSKAQKVAELEAQIRSLEDANLTDAEKAERDLEEARDHAQSLAVENAVLRAGVDYKLSAEDIELLGEQLQGIPAGDVPERAAKLAARLGAGTPTKPLSARPQEALRGGADPITPINTQGDWLREALTRANDN